MHCPKCQGKMAEEKESDFYGSTPFYKCLICRKIICHLDADVHSEMESAP
jgi:hypothetical protein